MTKKKKLLPCLKVDYEIDCDDRPDISIRVNSVKASVAGTLLRVHLYEGWYLHNDVFMYLPDGMGFFDHPYLESGDRIGIQGEITEKENGTLVISNTKNLTLIKKRKQDE